MAQSFITAPTPIWNFNNRIGLPNVNGFMKTFINIDKSTLKNVYKDAAGSIPYSQPISFQAAGQRGPFYWEVSDPPVDTDAYFLEIYQQDGQLIQTIENFQPAGSGGAGPVTINQDFNNLVPNGQFRFIPSFSTVNAPTSAEVAYGGWHFVKSNDSATDEVKFNIIPPGSLIPDDTPIHEFDYVCTVPGSGESEKFLEIRFRDVRSMEGKGIHIRFQAKVLTGLTDLELTMFQFFGTGGSPSSSVLDPIVTAALTGVYQTFNFDHTVLGIGGKIVGTNNDDYISLRFNFPRDSAVEQILTNVQVTLGSNILPYQYQSTNEAVGDILPPIEAGLTNKVLNIDGNGILNWGSELPVGSILIWPLNTPPANWLECDGALISTTLAPELFALLGFYYGGSASLFGIPDYRGYFLRGVNGASGRDPDVGSRTPAPGGTAADAGSTQVDEFESHTHEVKVGTVSAGGGAEGTGGNPGFPSGATGGNETRPINTYVQFIIKAV